MLHIRVASPRAVTSDLLARLTGTSGVTGIVIIAGASPRAGSADDAIQFDVDSGAANGVLATLRGLGLDRSGRPVTITAVDAAITSQEHAPLWRPSSRGDRAPVWELIEARIGDDARYAPSFFLLLIFAGIIGACGILTNSQILIVGAMVVGPEYSAIISVALGLERHDGATVRRGLMVLLAGFAAAIAVTLVFALCIRWIGHTPTDYLTRVRPVSSLINTPNLFSVVVAVVAGLVGVISLTLSRAGALIGVFISVTTIPAAADLAVSVAFGAWREASGSAVQLLLNVGLLIIVGAAALRAQRLIWRRRPGQPPGDYDQPGSQSTW